MADWFQVPAVSTATGKKMWEAESAPYFTILFAAALFAAEHASLAVWSMCDLLLLLLLFLDTAGSIGPVVKTKKKIKSKCGMIVVPSEWLVEQGRIKTLDCDWQPLENERSFLAVTRHFTNLVAKVFEEMVCRVVRWAQGLHGNWKESVH